MSLPLLILLACIPLFAPPDDVAEAKAHFEMYLADCDIDEIRCVWFLDHQQQSGMVMTINIRKYRVDTVRDVHNWARQASHSQNAE